jgi:prepilin-type N-terminal cleavage/methylation domain-containing protein
MGRIREEGTVMKPETGTANDREAGFTLIEVLMGIVLTGIMLGALTGGVLTYMRGAQATTDLLNITPELQIASTYFGSDVQSSEDVTTSPATSACAPAGTLVKFGWEDFTTRTASTQVDVSYSYDPDTHELLRTACKDDVVDDQTTLITHVKPGPPPLVLCDLDASCVAPTPRRIDMTMSVCALDASNACRGSEIPGTLTGVRRLPS